MGGDRSSMLEMPDVLRLTMAACGYTSSGAVGFLCCFNFPDSGELPVWLLYTMRD